MIEDIYRLFLQCPLSSGALVFRDNIYEGVLLKKDLELAIKEQDESIDEKITSVPPEGVESFLFSGKPRNKSLIPCLTPEGRPLEPIMYEEFISEFFPEDYRLRFSPGEMLLYYEHPLLALNRFKTVLYANKGAEDLFEESPLNRRINDLLEGFNLSTQRDRLLVSRGKRCWIMFTACSHTPRGLLYLYQFIRSDEHGSL